MLDLIPWLDETNIVEMGRLFFSGADDSAFTTLFCSNGVSVKPLYYVGPALQELMFRCFGMIGARICPYLGLLVAYAAFRIRVLKVSGICRVAGELLALALLTSPLIYQSALLTRVDCWSLACVFLSLAALGSPGAPKSVRSLFLGAFFAVTSFFVWPTAFILLPVYPAFSFSRSELKEFLTFCAFACLSGLVLLIPAALDFAVYWKSFNNHYSEVSAQAWSLGAVLVPILRECARSPFLALLSLIGLAVWVRRRRFAALIAFGMAFAVAANVHLYIFRIVYLTPLLFLMCVDAVIALYSLYPRLTKAYLVLTVAYGVFTGPVGHHFLSYPVLPADVKDVLRREIGTGPVRVFSPDHATYYIGRELGWRQIGFALPSEADDPEKLARVLADCDAAVLRDFDPYTPFQQSFTPYGIFCRYVLKCAREERDVPYGEKSRAARFGSGFSFGWHNPLRLEGFSEVARSGMIRIFRRTGRSPAQGR